MIFFVFCRVVITLLTLCACQCNSCSHDFHLHVFYLRIVSENYPVTRSFPIDKAYFLPTNRMIFRHKKKTYLHVALHFNICKPFRQLFVVFYFYFFLKSNFYRSFAFDFIFFRLFAPLEGLLFYKNIANTEAPTTVQSPATAIDKELIAPSISPISIAFTVPIACADVPSAKPLAIG